jgi:putative sporulation protein YyaC
VVFGLNGGKTATESTKVFVDQPLGHLKVAEGLAEYLDREKTLVILCIGTDRSTGDSLGPIIGTKLIKEEVQNVFGTLEEPVHAVNLGDTICEIKRKFGTNVQILAIDACLGRSESVGYISVKEGSLKPGTGVNKDLPSVGTANVIGIVNIGGFMEYMVLQNTRLSLVMKMAEMIKNGITAFLRGQVVVEKEIAPSEELSDTVPRRKTRRKQAIFRF